MPVLGQPRDIILSHIQSLETSCYFILDSEFYASEFRITYMGSRLVNAIREAVFISMLERLHLCTRVYLCQMQVACFSELTVHI